jgi:molybdopterin-guanine dinucleotide biosynthesis protein A
MGGVDKALLPLAGVPLVAHAIRRLAGQCGPLAISAGGDPARFAAFGVPVLPDPPTSPAGSARAERAGPLAGILSALDWAAGQGAAQVLTVPVDTPFLPPDFVARLSAIARGRAAVAASPDAAGVLRRHGACGLWPVDGRDRLRAALAGGLRRVADWADAEGAAVAAFPGGADDPFLNLNTPEDLAEAERRLAGSVGFPGSNTHI